METMTSLPLPVAFLDFLKENGVDPSVYATADSLPRYIRLKHGAESQIPEIEAELNCKLEKVAWLLGFFALPPQIQIAGSKSYRNGKVYGIDAASGAAVVALDISHGDHVLDLCAAPGGSACVAAMGAYSEWTPRKSWKERKKANNARNGINSKLASATIEPELIFYGKHSGLVGLSKSELFRAICETEALDLGYDKVLVDAECTHDGSFRHIQKYERWGWETLQHRLLSAQRIATLTDLQLQLLSNGFRLLKVGGSLVYSTCSLTIAQNEGVVKQFLSGNPSAGLKEIDAAQNWPCRNGRIPNTIRFDPLTSQTSGLFIAKIVKSSR